MGTPDKENGKLEAKATYLRKARYHQDRHDLTNVVRRRKNCDFVNRMVIVLYRIRFSILGTEIRAGWYLGAPPSSRD